MNMDKFQLLIDGFPAAPLRESWEEAAGDAVAAGLAAWATDMFPNGAIKWMVAGQARIRRGPVNHPGSA